MIRGLRCRARRGHSYGALDHQRSQVRLGEAQMGKYLAIASYTADGLRERMMPLLTAEEIDQAASKNLQLTGSDR